MTYAYDSDIRLGQVVLNVTDLAGQTAFYTKYIGFSILYQTADQVQLGLAGSDEVILILRKTRQALVKQYGLFHIALLFPDRASLGAALKHLLVSNQPLTGGADHGYSEAIYLDDLEGNGIELYRDKPVSDWDIRQDGRIVGVTEELDADGLLAEASPNETYRLAAGTRMGHVHLSAKNALASSKLYQRIFNLGDKMSVPSASWIASGTYHHQLAFNQWAGTKLPKQEENSPGLAYLTIEFQDSLKFVASMKKAEIYHLPILEKSENHYLIEDSDGIRTKVVLRTVNEHYK